MMLDRISLAENLRNARLSKEMTQKDLAEYLQVYPKDISRWEHGERVPSVFALAKICIVLGVSADTILEIK